MMLVVSYKMSLGWPIIYDVSVFIVDTSSGDKQEGIAHQLSGVPEPPSACQSTRKGA